MATYEHRKLVERITELDKFPKDSVLYPEWVKAKELLKLIERNASSGELVIYASGRNVFVNSVLVKESELRSLTAKDLVYWRGGVSQSRAGYSWISTEGEVSLDLGGTGIRAWPINKATPLVYLIPFQLDEAV